MNEIVAQLRQAAKLPIGASQEKLLALNAAKNQPYQARNGIPPILSILRQTTQPTTATLMFNYRQSGGIEDVQRKAAETLKVVAQALPDHTQGDWEPVVKNIFSVCSELPHEDQTECLNALSHIGPFLSDETVHQTIIPEVKSKLNSESGTSETSQAYLLLIGQLLAKGVDPKQQLTKLLEETVDLNPPESRGLTAFAAGYALLGPDPYVERLASILRRGAGANDADTLQLTAAGACVGMAAEEETAQEIGVEILEDLQDSPDEEAARRAVPRGIEFGLDETPAEVACRQVGYLEDALEDDSEAVQTAVVEAVIECLTQREDSEVIEQFARLLETAILETAGDARMLAVEALDNEQVRQALTETIDSESAQLTRAVEETLVSPPAETGVTRLSTQIDLATKGLKPQTEKKPDEEIEEMAENFAEQYAPKVAVELYEEAESTEMRRFVVETVRQWFESEISETNAPWQTVETAWESDERPVRLAALSAAGDAFPQHVEWEAVAAMFDAAMSEFDDELRREALDQIHDLLGEEEIAWTDVEQWVDAAVDDPSLDVWGGGLKIVGQAMETGIIDWPDAKRYIRDGTESSARSVRGHAVIAVLRGLRGERIEWHQIEDLFLENSVRSGDKRLRIVGIVMIRKLIKHNNISWGEVREFIEPASRDEEDRIAKHALKCIKMAIIYQGIEWDEIEEYVLSINFDRTEPAAESVRVITAAIDAEVVTWDEVCNHLADIRDAGHPKLAGLTISTIEELIENEAIQLADVKSFFEESLRSLDSTAKLVIGPTIDRLLRQGDVAWGTVEGLLSSCIGDERKAVEEAAVAAVFNAVIKNEVSWGEVQPFLQKAATEGSDRVQPTIIETVGVSLQEGDPEWDEVERLIEREIARGEEDGIFESLRAIRSALAHQDIPWEDVEGYLQTFQNTDDERVAQERMKLVVTAFITDSIEWESTRRYLNEGLNSDSTALAELTVKLVGQRLSREDVAWEDAQELINRARASARPSVVNEAVRAVNVGLKNDVVTWSQTSEFYHRALTGDSPVAARFAVRGLNKLYRADVLEWTEISALVLDEGIVKTTEVRKRQVELLGRAAIQKDAVWGEIDEIIKEATSAKSPPEVAKFGMYALQRVLGEGLAPWSDVEQWLHRGLESHPEHPEVAVSAVQTLGIGFSKDAIEWEKAEEFLQQAVTHPEEEVAVEAMEAISIYYKTEETASYTDAVDILRTARNRDVPVLYGEAVFSCLISYEMTDVEWERVETFITTELESADGDTATAIARAIRAWFKINASDSEVERGVGILEQVWEIEDARTATLQALRSIVANEHGVWNRAQPLLRKALTADDEALAKTGLSVTGMGLQKGVFDWAEVEPYLKKVQTEHSSETAAETLKNMSAALSTESTNWSEVKGFLEDTIQLEDEPLPKLALRKMQTLVQVGIISWEEAEPLFKTARKRRSHRVSWQSLEVLGEAMLTRTLRWFQVSGLVASGIKAESKDMVRAATAVAGMALRSGTAQWEEVAHLLRKGRDSGHTQATENALQGVIDGLANEHLTWQDARPFLESTPHRESGELASKYLDAIRAGVITSSLEADEAVDRLLKLHDRLDIDAEIATLVLEVLSEGESTVSELEPLILAVYETGNPRERLTLLEAVSAQLEESMNPVTNLSVIREGMTDERSGLQLVALNILANVLNNGWLSNREDELSRLLSDIIKDGEPTVQQAALETTAVALANDSCDTAVIREVVQDVVKNEESEMAPQTRAEALQFAVGFQEELNLDKELVEMVQIAGTAEAEDSSLRVVAIRLISTIVETEIVIENHSEELEEFLWKQLEHEEGGTRIIAESAEILAEMHSRWGATVTPERAELIQEVLANLDVFSAETRLDLVDMVVTADEPPVPHATL